MAVYEQSGWAGYMQGSAEVFESTLRRLEDQFPQVATEVRDEVNRGRLVKGGDLPENERSMRQDRLSEKKLGRITKNEMAVVAYTGDEKLALLCEAILNLVLTMTTTRRTLLKMINRYEVEEDQIVFAEPDEAVSGRAHVNVSDELATVERVSTQVSERLQLVLGEVRTWR